MKKQSKTLKMTTKTAKKATVNNALIQSLVEKDLKCLESGPAPVCGGILNC